MSYQSEYDRSIIDPQGFWLDKTDLIEWVQKPQVALADDMNGSNDGTPMAYSIPVTMQLIVTLRRAEDQVAIYYDSPVTDTKKSMTYSQLQEQVARFAVA